MLANDNLHFIFPDRGIISFFRYTHLHPIELQKDEMMAYCS